MANLYLCVLVVVATMALNAHAQCVNGPRAWQPVMKGKAIKGKNDRDLSGKALSLAQCKKACAEEKTFVCSSIDYNASKKVCKLSKSTKDNAVLGSYAGFEYHELTCPCRGQRVWSVVKDRAIKGHNAKSLPGKSLASCRAACLAETSFECRSIDFRPRISKMVNSVCKLSREDKTTLPAKAFLKLGGFEYHELSCPCAKGVRTWFPTMKNKAIKGHNDKSLTRVKTVEDCKKKCRDEKSFVCRSIDWRKAGGICKLSKATKNSAHLGDYANFEYHELDCPKL